MNNWHISARVSRVCTTQDGFFTMNNNFDNGSIGKGWKEIVSRPLGEREVAGS